MDKKTYPDDLRGLTCAYWVRRSMYFDVKPFKVFKLFNLVRQLRTNIILIIFTNGLFSL